MPESWISSFEPFWRRHSKWSTRDSRNQNYEPGKRGVPITHAISNFLAEVVLFVLDLAVNQEADGTLLYRLTFDLHPLPKRTRARGGERLARRVISRSSIQPMGSWRHHSGAIKIRLLRRRSGPPRCRRLHERDPLRSRESQGGWRLLLHVTQREYLDNDASRPIEKELNDHAAVVFIHPTMRVGYQLPSPMLQPPAFDFPLQTGQTAAHVIVIGGKRRFPRCKIILSHAGGTLPVLSERLAQLNSELFSSMLELQSPKTYEAIVENAKPFYFDLALAGTTNVLDSLLKLAPKEHLFYGSNYPYVIEKAEFNTRSLKRYEMLEESRNFYYAENEVEVFPRLTKLT